MTRTIPGECEALAIVRELAEASSLEAIGYVAGIQIRAMGLMRALRLRPGQCQAGAPCRIPPETLRRVSQLHARGMTQQQIATQLKLRRDSVKHHLKPSPAMIAAMID